MKEYSKILVVLLLLSQLFGACANKQGETLSGFPFQLIVSEGGQKVKEGDIVYYHVSSYANGKRIKTSRNTDFPQVFEIPDANKLRNMESPFLEVLVEMGAGDSAIVIQNIQNIRRVPPEFEGAKEILFGVQLIRILDREAYEIDRLSQKDLASQNMQAYKSKSDEVKSKMILLFENPLDKRFDDFTVTESGIKYKVLKEGTGKERGITKEHMLDLSYYAFLSDGTPLESSYNYGKPYRFVMGAGNVMPGWNELALLFTEGTELIAFIPAEQAFGERAFKGNVEIPANEDLYFHFVFEHLLPVKKY